VARKTGNVVLGTGYGIASGVVVDTHVIRLTRRLDLTRHEDPKKIEQDLMAILPQNKWIQFSHQLIWHGRRVCVARKPRCIECNLEKICYSKDKTVRAGLHRGGIKLISDLPSANTDTNLGSLRYWLLVQK